LLIRKLSACRELQLNAAFVFSDCSSARIRSSASCALTWLPGTAPLSELADMRGMIERMNGASKNPAEVARMNRLFHATIHDAAHNQYLAQALSQLSDSLALPPRTTFEVHGRTEEAHKEHLAMLEAIERRAPEEAERLARRHIENAGAARIQMMFEAS
jgi:DNA-binding GntR family transcriptional regulator